ncbi:site-specific integrase [Sphingomonas populi]|uniref:Site-specific integrase n=1 Tax=Sphingomonas populi TaxID=2484750 RepID=A0A4Q6XM39_9SPHN|nr:site-specific integrase [Sphingomonas populi]RZF61220.1 site-specific integrase [Sphingomonas populi]
MILLKSKAAWSEQRQVWRLDIQFQDASGASKRTFIVIPGAEPHKSRGAAEATRAAKEFAKGIGGLYAAFLDKNGATKRPKPVAKPTASPMKVRKGANPTVAWLLDRCLEHPEIWGPVKHPANYISGVRKLNAIVGDRMVSEFEPPNGRALVMEVVKTLRAEGHSDGYVRKIAGQLRQALGAAIGQAITEPITHPENGTLLINDMPTFPPLPKSKGRTATLDRAQDEIVFSVITERLKQAAREERAYAVKHGKEHELGIGAVGRVEIDGAAVWLNSRRYSSTQWRIFADYIRFLLETGCRRSEGLSVGNHSIRYREVTDDDGNVTERRPVLFLPGEVTKNGDDRTINLTPRLQELMKVWQATAKPHTFKIGARTITREKAWFPLVKSQVEGMWSHVRADVKRVHAVDLSAISPHLLRHTHATRMSERGMSGKPLQDHLGHRDARTTQIYDHAQQVDNSARFYKRNVSS